MENISLVCKFCGFEWKNRNALQAHERQCKANPNRSMRKSQQTCKFCCNIFDSRSELSAHCKAVHGSSLFSHEQLKGTYTCTFCKKSWLTSKNGLRYHEVHCQQNPERLMGSGFGRIWSEESKKKVSETQKKNFKESGAKSIWRTQLENRKSFAEQYFDTCFPNLKQNYHVDRYFLDLANPEKKLYIEVDGEQHYNDQRIVEHDKIRTKRLEELGWKCLRRIRWSEYKKLSKEDQESLITELQNQI